MNYFNVISLSKRTEDSITLNTIRKPSRILKFRDDNSGHIFTTTDVEKIKFKRNLGFDSFYNTYKNTSQFSVLEFVLYDVDEYKRKFESIFLMIKRKSIKMDRKALDYIWIFDVGDNNFKPHIHLLISVRKINTINRKLSKFLMFKFKGKKIYSSFTRDLYRTVEYLKRKEVFERGLRKQSYRSTIKHIRIFK